MANFFIYLSTSCSKSKFHELQQRGINRDVPQAQKYHRLLIEGLSKNKNCKVHAISLIPTNRTWCKKIIFHRTEEQISESLRYVYLPFFNYPIIKYFFLYFCVKKEIKNAIREHLKDNVYIVCDIWNQTLSNCARSIGKKTGIKVLGIVTDVPKHRSNAYSSHKFGIKTMVKNYVERKTYKNAGKYDYYLLLTKSMNCVVNPEHKPYVVLEGHSDVNMADVKNELINKKHPKVIMYAGTLHGEYGIEMLVNAFIRGNFSDWELHVYGKGNFEDNIKKITRLHSNVKYFGLASNEHIVNEQLRASLIVNPRPTNADYVKYSFPSKTLEAMVSGTPLLTTKLPGMPDEYLDFVYTFDEETENGYLTTLKNVLCKSELELFDMGKSAKHYALTEKNNVSQAQKVIALLESLC